MLEFRVSAYHDFGGAALWGSTAGIVTDIDIRQSAGYRYDNAAPRSAYLRCTHCGTRSMIPQSVDKITPLVCPQCGGKLDG